MRIGFTDQRPLAPEEAVEFTRIVCRIAAILLLGPALDASYAAVKTASVVV